MIQDRNSLKVEEKEVNPMIEVIVQAMLRLLNRKDFKNISVNDICKEAAISRSTFYRYFKDKYELVRNILNVLWKEEARPGLVNIRNNLYFLLKILKKHRVAFLNILHYHGPDEFEDYLFDYLLYLFPRSLHQKYEPGLIFNTAGVEKLILVWMRNGCLAPIECLISEIENQLSSEVLYGYSFEKNRSLKKMQDVEIVRDQPMTSEQQNVLNVFVRFCQSLIHPNVKAMKDVVESSMNYLLPDGSKESFCTFYQKFKRKDYNFVSIRLQEPQIYVENNRAEIRMEKLELFGSIENEIGAFEDRRTFLFQKNTENKWKLIYSYPVIPTKPDKCLCN